MRMIAAIAPLCATIPIFGFTSCGGRSTLNSKVSAAPSAKLHMPMQLGPSIATPAARAATASFSWSARPASPTSAKPEANTIAPPTPRRPHAVMASAAAVCGTTSTATSTPCGSASMPGMHAAR